MRKTLGVAALLLALCCPALAGEIPNPPAPTPQGVTVEGPTLNGEMPTPPGVTEIALELLALLPSLL